MKWIKGITTAITLLFSSLAWSQDCNVHLTSVNFGGFDSRTVSPVVASGYIDVTCSQGVGYLIKLGPGQNSGNTFNPRKMQASGSGSTLNYNLFRDSTHSQIWGDATGGTFIQSGVGVGVTKQFVIYGLIPGGQNVPADSYSDQITVTIEW